MTRPSGQTVLLASVIAGSCLLVGYLLVAHDAAPGATAAAATSRMRLADIPFNGQRAFEYLEALCALGPRPSGSPGMQAQRELLSAHFQKLGGTVGLQPFRVRHPETGAPVSMANMIVEWHPDRRERIMLCAHYDTRPYPDRDPRDPRGTFLGANDGGSGTALLMELAQQMAALPGRLGVDFVLFDGEEFIFEDGRDRYFLGSEFFANDYTEKRHAHRYRASVLFDLVADAQLQIYPDRYSLSWEDTRPLVEQIWNVAKRLGVSEFSIARRYEVLDDHIKLHEIAKIPSCDIIDFNYPYWHTQDDRPEHCSALSLAKVGWVVQEWLKQAVRK